MKQTFRLKKGQISFDEDRIFISDNAKRQKYLVLTSSVIWMLFGFINVSKFEQSGDDFFYSFWLVLIVINFLLFVFTLLRSSKTSISLADVKSIKVKQRFSNSILDIKLKNNQLRRVLQIEEVEELKEYIDKRFDGLTGM